MTTEPPNDMTLEEMNEMLDQGLRAMRVACSPFSLDELLKMLMEGKNPLRGDKP